MDWKRAMIGMRTPIYRLLWYGGLALPQYTKISCENKECSYILIVLLEVFRWPFETKHGVHAK